SVAPAESVRVRQAIDRVLNATVQRTVIHAAEAGIGQTTMDGGDSNSESAPFAIRGPLPTGPRYTRTLLHASGGMGSVWLARDTDIGRNVALKELRAEVAGGSVPVRFLREARITGQLEHPGVVPVYEIGSDPATGQPFYTMRFVRGRTLTEAAQAFHEHRQTGHDDPLEFVSLLGAFVSVCHTIAYAHSHGVIHRDLKGENIILGDYGEVIVLDWGLAKRLDHAGEDDIPVTPTSEAEVAPGQTMMGQVMGTPAYMAPEQALGRLDLIGPATDIFGIGAIFYEILTGRAPFTGAGTVQVLSLARKAAIAPPREFWPEVPPALEAMCLKALSKKPADRYAKATEFARLVQGWQDKQRRQAEDELRQAGERLMQQQKALVNLTRSEVFSEPELSATFRRMIEVAARTLEVERVGVWRYLDGGQAIRCELLFERATGRTSSGVVLHERDFPAYFAALQSSEVIPAHDAREDSRTSAFTDSYLNPLGIGAIMDAPIHVDGELYGVVCHEHVGPPRKWMPDEQLFAIAIANLVSQAVSLHEHRRHP
ncbi:MAG: protein kinase, partial [Planctomycetaceae bacterium]|nr:protein kinase [Planctomycetaceae bacterium]